MATRILEAGRRLRLAETTFAHKFLFGSFLWMLLAACPLRVSGSVEPLVTFTPAANLPQAGLILASDGNLYGTTAGNGSAVYRLNTDGTFTVLHSFAESYHAVSIVAGVTEGPDHNLYGTVTSGGGDYLFKVTPDGQFSDVFDFPYPHTPVGPLILGQDGKLHGTYKDDAEEGGVGAIYQYSPTGGYSAQQAFPPGVKLTEGSTIYLPTGGMAQTDDGALYGFFNAWGGVGNVMYKLAADGTFSLIDLTLPGDLGGTPKDAVAGADGNLYSVTDGTVFMATPAGAVTILKTSGGLASDIPGRLSRGPDGAIYGATRDGVVKVDASGVTLVAASFLGVADTNGDGPYAIAAADGTFYATEGETFNQLVHLRVDGSSDVLHAFVSNAQSVFYPGPVKEGADGNFYGISAGGGARGFGTIFRVTPAGAVTVLHSFESSAYPVSIPVGAVDSMGALVQARNGVFYGTTQLGGDYSAGSVFSITTDGAFTTIYSFQGDAVEQGKPLGFLVEGPDGALYGLTQDAFNPQGATAGIFRITTDGQFTLVHSFGPVAAGDQLTPMAPLLVGSDGILYGSVISGSGNGAGSLYSLTTDGTYTTLHTLVNTTDPITGGGFPIDGFNPGSPVEGPDGALYGSVTFSFSTAGLYRMTKTGDYSILPRIQPYYFPPDGGVVEVNPPLLLAPDGNFYGSSNPYFFEPQQPEGIFKITPGRVAYPQYFEEATYGRLGDSVLTLSRAGQIYGSSQSGGANGGGLIYHFTPQPLPVAHDDYLALMDGKAHTLSVVVNDESPNGFPLTIVETTPPIYGTISVLGNSITYTPSKSFAQSAVTDTFTYTVRDKAGDASTATVSLSNGFYQQRGSYTGTLSDFPGAYLTANLSGGGMVTGTLRLLRGSYTFKAQLSPSGDAILQVGGEQLELHLRMNAGDPAASGLSGTYGKSAFVLAPKAAPSATAGLAGYYTFLLSPHTPLDPTVSAGIGFGTAQVSAQGAVRMTGVLANGEAFSASSVIFHDQAGDSVICPVRLGSKNPGGLTVNFQFAMVPGESDFHGSVDWMNLAGQHGMSNTGTFRSTLTLAGSRYAAPAAGTLPLGGLPDGYAANVTYTSAVQSGFSEISLGAPRGPQHNEATNASGVDVQPYITFNRRTGLFTGHSLLPNGNSVQGKVSFRGAVLSRNSSAGGFYLTGGVSGAIRLSMIIVNPAF